MSFASDYPQHGIDGFGGYAALTSKQRWVLDEMERLAKAGRKTILYAENPGLLELLSRRLTDRGVDNMVFHGKIPIRQRTRELNQRFRFGDCPIAACSLGVAQKGLNIWQANEVIVLSRSWLSSVEEQAIARTLRPQQKANVRVRYVHLTGSIDVYKAQMVEFKQDAADSGLDWATPQKSGAEFLHLDTVLHRFIEGLAELRGVKAHKLRDHLKGRAA